jgi:hypothetical protein
MMRNALVEHLLDVHIDGIITMELIQLPALYIILTDNRTTGLSLIDWSRSVFRNRSSISRPPFPVPYADRFNSSKHPATRQVYHVCAVPQRK